MWEGTATVISLWLLHLNWQLLTKNLLGSWHKCSHEHLDFRSHGECSQMNRDTSLRYWLNCLRDLRHILVGYQENFLPGRSGQALAQSAHGSGRVTILGGVPELWRFGTEEHGLVGMVRMGQWLDLIILVVFCNLLWFYDSILCPSIVFIISFSELTTLVVLVPILVAFPPSTIGTICTQHALFWKPFCRPYFWRLGAAAEIIEHERYLLNNFLISAFLSSDSERMGQ